MEYLPFRAHAEIFSYLDLNDQANCRLVCRALRCSVEYHLRTNSHIRIPHNQGDYESVGSYIYENFINKHFVEAHPCIEYTKNLDKYPSDHLFSFIGKFCPNLHVLDAHIYTLTRENLLHLPQTLRYFRCHKVKVPQGKETQAVEELFSRLKSLQAFDANVYELRSKQLFLLAKKLIERNKPILRIMNPSKRLMDKETFESLAAHGIRCLEYNALSNERGTLHPISSKVAKYLTDLSINFLPSDAFCQSPLPSLTYLEVESSELVSGVCRNVLFSSPGLQFIELGGRLNLKLLSDLFRHFHSLKHLQRVYLDVDLEEEAEDVVTFALPASVRSFSMKLDAQFEIISCNSQSLIELNLDFLVNLDFNLPNLRVLKCELTRLDSLGPEFLTSLSKSPKLRKIFVHFEPKNVPAASYVQSLLDVCSKMSFLEKFLFHVHLEEDDDYDEEEKEKGEEKEDSSDRQIVIHQENFPSVKHFNFRLPYDLIFYTKYPFESLELSSNVHLRNFKNDVRCHLYGKTAKVIFDENMNNLTKLRFYPESETSMHSSFRWFIPQLKFLNQVRELYLSPNDRFTLLDTRSLEELDFYEPILFCSKQLESLNYKGSIRSRLIHKLFGFFCSLEHLRDVDFDVDVEEGTLLKVPLSPYIRKFSFHANVPIELSVRVPNSLEYLQIETSKNLIFNFPKLREFHLNARIIPPSLELLDSLRNSPQLYSFDLTLSYGNVPSPKYLQSLIAVAAEMRWASLEVNLGLFSNDEGGLDGTVILNQSELPSLTRFIWNMPMNIILYPCNVFDTLRVYNSTDLTCCDPKVRYMLHNYELISPRIENLSSLTRLNHFEINHYENSLTHHNLAEILTRLPNIQSVSYEPTENSDALLAFFASLLSLREFTGVDLSQEDLKKFLSKIRRTFPLSIKVRSYSNQFITMDGDLHSLLIDMKDRNLISSFASTWFCNCESACWLQEHNREDTYPEAYLEALY